ncbi:MAG: hydroxyacylglutathione hydrolase [Deltaproteobacteria bacterium]|nr:hydroxyacylglutathione hydrolase [Deltaproteobacteria bacterium]
MDVVPIPLLSDNYGYLLVSPDGARAAVVDCSDAAPVLREVERRGLRLQAILSTHHHFDHVGGNEDAARAVPGLRVVGSRADRARVPALTEALADGERFEVAGLHGRALYIPAHTSGHLAYVFEDGEPNVFSGDTLFAAGCGRLFEGSPAQMMASLGKLAALPDATRVYCGHEYTEKNLRFAHELEPGNRAIAEKLARVERMRAEGLPTVPSTIAEEKATNPFLRWRSPELRASIRARFPDAADDDVTVFAKTRELKDSY